MPYTTSTPPTSPAAVSRARKRSGIVGALVLACASTLVLGAFDVAAANPPGDSIYAPSNTYANATHRTYRYSLVMPTSGVLHNIHVGVPAQAVIGDTAAIYSPSFGNKGTSVRYPTYFDYSPPIPSRVDSGQIIEFLMTEVTNPPASTASALIEAWNTDGEKFISLTTTAKTFELAPAPVFAAASPYPVPDRPCTPARYTTAGENVLPGDGGWRLSQPADQAAPQIEGYADRTSAACGQTVTLRVNVTDGSPTFSLDPSCGT